MFSAQMDIFRGAVELDDVRHTGGRQAHELVRLK